MRVDRVFVVTVLELFAKALSSDVRYHILSQTLEEWSSDDQVEVFYGEFLLSTWTLHHSPWNAYHSGLAFVNNRTGQKALFDYVPVNTSSVGRMLYPDIDMSSPWRAMLGDTKLTWHNAAETTYHKDWPDTYTNFVSLARLNGSIYNSFAVWARDSFAPAHKTFDPIEVVSAPISGNGLSVGIPSCMCHDFVVDGLWALYRLGVRFESKDIFRDHIMMYASSMEKMSDDRLSRRRQLRWYRFLALWLDSIKQQFVFARDCTASSWSAGVAASVRTRGSDYRVNLVPPFMNYCYLPLELPPRVPDVFAQGKLCALPMEANLTNITSPFPWGPLLSAEEQLDDPVTLLSWVLVAVVAVAGAQCSADQHGLR